jgi:Cof subfamily protein (haloacid dehalogenase superfamily)
VSIKIAFFDVDGTLYHNRTIADSTRNAIHRLHEEGIITAVCTGRNVIDGGAVARELEIPNLVSFNGAIALAEGQIVHSYAFDPEELAKISKFAKELQVPIVFHTLEQTVSEQADHPDIVEILSNWGISLPIAGLHNDNPVFQVNLYLQEAHDRTILDAFPGIFLYRWHQKAIDLQRSGVSKAIGVAKMIEHFGLKPEDAIAFGDGGNDVEMLSYVGTGVAMGNAVPTAKRAADYVTDSVDDD